MPPILPFFNGFIRGRGFHQWRGRLIGTEEGRAAHPFPWTYDEGTEEVHWVNARFRPEDGEFEETDLTFTIPEALKDLLASEVETALSEVRAKVVAEPSATPVILRAYGAEVDALKRDLDRDPGMLRYREFWDAIGRLEVGLVELDLQRQGELSTRRPRELDPRDGRVRWADKEERVQEIYIEVRKAKPSINKTEALDRVEERCMEEFGEGATPSRSTIRRYISKIA